MKSLTTERKKQILQEATRLFSESGYTKVTIKQLAEACGITEPALYRHFESKEAIYNGVLDGIENRLTSQTFFDQFEKEQDLETLLKNFSYHIIDFFTKNEDVYRLLLYSSLSEHSKAKEVFQNIRGAYVKFLYKKLDQLAQQNMIAQKNNELTARCFTGMVFDCALSITLWRSYQGKYYKPKDVIANNVPIYVKGLQE
ncbi:MAG: TetR/AcrR family transcriptional regulator [FCB group bacterium]|nr:TetR/AcrR family transcriptional regulator [FCB group bacterium]